MNRGNSSGFSTQDEVDPKMKKLLLIVLGICVLLLVAWLGGELFAASDGGSAAYG